MSLLYRGKEHDLTVKSTNNKQTYYIPSLYKYLKHIMPNNLSQKSFDIISSTFR